MAQHDYIIANQSGAAFRADLNNALAAIVSQNSGATEPSTTYAYQFWADTTAGVLKQRNAANSAWITLFQLDGEWSTIALENGSAAAPSLYFKDSGTDTGVYSPGTDQVGIATAGVQRVNFNGSTEVVFNDGGADVDFRIEGDTEPDLFKIDAGTDQVQVKNLNGGPLAGTRNRIINGDMRIDQRNAGASVTINDTGTYTLDRWYSDDLSDGSWTIQRSTTAPAGFNNSLLVTITAADTSLSSTQRCRLIQCVEGFNWGDLGWGTASAKSVTLSFWVRSSVTGTFSGALTNSAENRSYPFTYSVSAANTFEYKTITIAGDTSGTWLSDNGIGVRLIFSLGVGSNFLGTAGAWSGSFLLGATGETPLIGTNGATFYITGVQLEAGTVATPFERRSYGAELMLAQRYYQKNGQAAASAFALTKLRESDRQRGVALQFPVTMRAAPSIAIVDSDKDGSTNNFSVAAASTGGAKVTLLATADTQSPSIQIYTAEIEL